MFKFFGKFRHLLGLAALVIGLVSIQHTAMDKAMELAV